MERKISIHRAMTATTQGFWHLFKHYPATGLFDQGGVIHLHLGHDVWGTGIVDEFFVSSANPIPDVLSVKRATEKGGRPVEVVVWHDDPDSIMDPLEAIGLRASDRQTVMYYSLTGRSSEDGTREVITRISTLEQARTVNRLRGREIIVPTHLDDPMFSWYFMKIQGRPVASIGAIQVWPGLGFLTSLFTDPRFRRQGIATRLVVGALSDMAESGIRQTVLVAANQASYALFRSIGYEYVTHSQLFVLR